MLASSINVIDQIIDSFTLPGKKPFRWNDGYANSPTGVASPKSVQQLAFGDGTDNVAAGDLVIFQFRDAVRSSIVYNGNSTHKSQVYNLQFASSLDADNQTQVTNGITLVADAGEGVTSGDYILPLVSATTDVTSQWSPHGDTMYAAGSPSSDRKFIWIDATENHNALVTFNFSPVLTSGQALDVFLDYWNDGELQLGKGFNSAVVSADGKLKIKVPLDEQNTNPTNQGITAETNNLSKKNRKLVRAIPKDAPASLPILLDQAGYYSPRIQVGDFATNNIAVSLIQVQSAAESMCHKPLPFYDRNAASASTIKTMAASTFLENNSAVLSASGRIAAAQIPKGIPWTRIAYGSYEDFTSDPSVFTCRAAEGYFGWLKPDEDNDLKEFHSDLTFTQGATTPIGSNWPLEPRSGYLAIFVHITDDNAQSLQMTQTYGVEYQSVDTWRDLQPPSGNYEIYQAAVHQLRTMVQHTENPTHIRTLLNGARNAAKRAVGGIVKYGPGVLRFAQQLAGAL